MVNLRPLFLACACLPALAAQTKPNIILISLDQCQADQLHAYGNPRETSPNLDRMAREGVRFARFYSAASWTAPSYSSMLTSQYPSRHGVTIFFPRDMDAQKPTAIMLAEWLKKSGYHTAAFVNNSVAGRNITGRGFDEYDEGQRRPPSITERQGLRNPEYQAPATTQRILNWLDKNQQKPFFLFLLYFEPHSPYNPPPEHDIFKSSAYPNETNTGWDIKGGRLFRWADLGDKAAIERMTELYDGKIHFVDAYVGQVLQKLRDSGLARNTVVILTSDHGEMLYSHPDDFLTFDHRSLYDQVMHVPGILWGAGVPHGKTIRALATHIDIAPTLLDLAGLPAKPDAQGVSLVPLIRGREAKAHGYIFGEQDILEPLRSVRDERYKLILDERTGKRQLFDDRQDPGEYRDIALREPEVAARLGAILADWRKANEPPAEEREAKWRKLVAQGARTSIIDEVTTGAHLQLTGHPWKMADAPKNYLGGCFWTESARPGETPRTATWRADNPMLGRYRISIWYGTLPEGGVATDVPFTVSVAHGSKIFHIDETKNAGGWRDLGIFEDPLNVALSNRANGRVIVDAVKFERLD
ncbi:MAG: sulfatase-like hydrolase/transferase [Bryobacteraceae bacterium]